ncbi:MAG: glycosyltransferase [Saprospiraceae bacterium]|nr:glycosyltransferase [Candidatus Opimibacter skivensis]
MTSALDNLRLILKALSQQSCHDFEVIISEDDFNEETIRYFRDHSHTYSFPIRHLHQSADLGFRKNEMLNRSLRECKTELVAFIDGDYSSPPFREGLSSSYRNKVVFGRSRGNARRENIHGDIEHWKTQQAQLLFPHHH